MDLALRIKQENMIHAVKMFILCEENKDFEQAAYHGKKLESAIYSVMRFSQYAKQEPKKD